MNKKDIIAALKRAKETSPKRNFVQTVDLIVNLRGLDPKKPEHQMNLFVQLHYGFGREVKVCGLVGPELRDGSAAAFQKTILVDDFEGFAQDKKAVKKLANEFDYFVAQASVMPKVATVFGRVFGPKGKMPNPKAGCVVPAQANLAQIHARLQKMAHVAVKQAPSVKVPIGKESDSEDHVADNAMSIYTNVIHHLPQAEQNIKSIIIKLTMGPPIRVGGTEIQEEMPVKVRKGKQPAVKEAQEGGTEGQEAEVEESE